MNGRERIFSCLDFKRTDFVPVAIPYVESLYLRQRTEELTGYPWHIPRYGTVEEIVLMYRRCREAVGMDWTKVNMGDGLRPWERLEKIDGELYVSDERSTAMKAPLERPRWQAPSSPEDFISCEADLLRLLPLTDEEEMFSSHPMRVAAEVVKDINGEFFTYANIGTPFMRALGRFGFVGFFQALHDVPALAAKAIERIHEDNRIMLRIMSRLGLDGVWIECTMSGADMISLKHYDCFAHPYEIQTVREAEKAGLKTFFYFTGNPMDRLDRLVSLGADCLAVEEDKKAYGISLERVKEAAGGKTALMGNTDVMPLEKGDFQTIKDELSRFRKIGSSGGLIVGCGSPVTPDTPVRNVSRFVEMARGEADRGQAAGGACGSSPPCLRLRRPHFPERERLGDFRSGASEFYEAGEP